MTNRLPAIEPNVRNLIAAVREHVDHVMDDALRMGMQRSEVAKNAFAAACMGYPNHPCHPAYCSEASRMTEAERIRLIIEWYDIHRNEWCAWNSLPLAEQAANLDKIDAASRAGGLDAARAMARALGLPMPPDELADPDDVLAARRAEGDQWMLDVLATHTKLTQDEIDDLMQPMPASRVDH